MTVSRSALPPALLLALLLALPPAAAQTKPPVAQFWMDAATINMSIPGMGDMDEGTTGMMGMMGNAFGTARMGMGAPGKWLDSALFTRNKPAGTEGDHAIPPGMAMGPSLPLLPVERQPSAPGREGESDGMEKPKGRLLFYWGCGETVRAGQPRVIDFAKAAPQEWGRFMDGRFAPERGARAIPGRSIWPNERDRQRVPGAASLVGEHEVAGAGVPAGLRFALRDGQDFMGKLQMTAAGDPKAAVTVAWQGAGPAEGYFLNAMGARGEEEMIIWSSSDLPDPGFGLLDYLAPSRVRQLIGEKVVLPPAADRCAIPAGVFAGVEGAMVRMIAYGPEANFAHPPRPANPKAPWAPEWAVRVRLKSTGMTVLGMEERGGGRRAGRGQLGPAEQSAPSPASPTSPVPTEIPGLGDVNPINLLKGLFGR